jgi:hypothetical protein
MRVTPGLVSQRLPEEHRLKINKSLALPGGRLPPPSQEASRSSAGADGTIMPGPGHAT